MGFIESIDRHETNRRLTHGDDHARAQNQQTISQQAMVISSGTIKLQQSR
jgi:hypothetical protein